MCSDKKCQDDQCVNMWPVKPPKDMQLSKPEISYQYKRLCCDKNCQSTRCYKKKNSHKQWQETQGVHMQSVNKSTYMQSAKPARKQVIHPIEMSHV